MSDIERQKQEAIDEAFKVFGSSAGAYGYLFDCGVAAQADRLAIAVEALERIADERTVGRIDEIAREALEWLYASEDTNKFSKKVIKVALGKITQEDIKSLLFNMPAEWRTRWCEPGEDGCGCMGCANASGGLARLGYTKEQWREALEKIK